MIPRTKKLVEVCLGVEGATIHWAMVLSNRHLKRANVAVHMEVKAVKRWEVHRGW